MLNARSLPGAAGVWAVCAALCCCAVSAGCHDRAAPAAAVAPAALSSQFNADAAPATSLPAVVIQSPAHALGTPDQADASAVAAPPLAPPVIHSAD